MTWALTVGAYPISLDDLYYMFTETSASEYVIFEIRIPRIVGAACVGAILSMSGLALQAIMRNDLAEPSLLGVSSGAALFAGISIIISPFLMSITTVDLRGINIVVFAFIGALAAVTAVQRLSKIHHKVDVQQLILTGVAINAICGAGAGLLSYISNDEQLRTLTFWTLGSFGALSNAKVLSLIVLAAIGLIYFKTHAKQLNLMTLGEHEAMHLGVKVESLKKRIILLVSLSVGIAVAFCGVIGFIGLVVPHMVRLIWGNNHQLSIGFTAVLGAIVMVVADMIARTIVLPSELPVGIVTAILGSPFFIHLLRKNQKKNLSC